MGSTPRKSVIVLLALMPHSQHHDLRGTDNLLQRNIPRSSEWDDQFSLHGVLRRLAEAKGCDRKLPLSDRSDGVDCRLGIVEIFRCLGPFKQEIEESFQIRFSGR